jgi:hypothetical protein
MEKSILPVLAVGIGLLLASSGCGTAVHGDAETSKPNRQKDMQHLREREIDERNSRPFPKLRLALLPLQSQRQTIMS